MNLTNDTLKPKFHHLLHYIRVILAIGPVWPQSCMRFEASHKPLKEDSDVIRCRKNICYSLAWKHQMTFSKRLMENRGFCNEIETGPHGNIFLNKLQDYEHFKHCIPNSLLTTSFTETIWVQINCVKYSADMMIEIEKIGHWSMFGQIRKILISANKVRFLFNKFHTIKFEHHYHAFQVAFTGEWNIISSTDIINVKPKNLYHLSSGKYYVQC